MEHWNQVWIVIRNKMKWFVYWFTIKRKKKKSFGFACLWSLLHLLYANNNETNGFDRFFFLLLCSHAHTKYSHFLLVRSFFFFCCLLYSHFGYLSPAGLNCHVRHIEKRRRWANCIQKQKVKYLSVSQQNSFYFSSFLINKNWCSCAMHFSLAVTQSFNV